MWGRFLCWVGFHDYTSNVAEGIEPDHEKMKKDPVGYFFEFSRQWCRRCKHDWEGNRNV